MRFSERSGTMLSDIPHSATRNGWCMILPNSMFRKTIGILGGIGPVASAETYVELTRLCQQQYGSVQDCDYPAVILYSLPLSDFSHRGFTNNTKGRKTVVAQLTKALRVLEQAGSDVIIIDCNTVHYFFQELQQSVHVPIIHLVQVTEDHVIKSRYNTVGLLCSQASKDIQLYTNPLTKAGITVLLTTRAEQRHLNEAILSVMGGTTTSVHTAHLNTIIDRLTTDGAEAVIIGCTEVSSIVNRIHHSAVLVDSEALAIQRAIEFAK